MAGIQLTGLASGMDWKTTVDQLMKIEQVPQDALKAKQAANNKVQAAFDTLKSNLTTLQSAAKGLQSGLSGYPRSATVSGYDSNTRVYSTASGASVSTASGAALGTYVFDVKSMGRASTLSSTVGSLRPTAGAASELTLKEYGVTSGYFTVNGHQVSITDQDLENPSFTLGSFLGLGWSDPNFTNSDALSPDVTGLSATIDSTGALTLDATTSIGADGDTSNFLKALGLSASSSGGTNVVFKQTMPASVLADVKLEDLVGGSGFSGGELTINGKSLSFVSGASVGDVVSAINSNADTGVTASIDALNGRLILTANAIGATAIKISSSSGGLDAILGIQGQTSVAGQGVTYSLTHDGTPVTRLNADGTPATRLSNGVLVPDTDLTSDSSTLDLSKYGFGSTQLTVSNTGGYSVQVTGSGAAYKSKINTFISAYNSLKQMLDDSTKITVGADGKVQTSVFSSRSDINSLLSTIRSKIYTQVSGVNSSFNSASKIGLGFDASGLLSITDSAKLDAALANNPSSVDALLNAGKSAAASTDSTQLGIATRVNNLLTVMVGTSGIVATGKTSLTNQNSRLQSQIDAMTRSLAQSRASLEKGFIAMEQAQSKYQSMSSQITAAFK
jgi:flagellar hook-associated protein 2